MINVCQTFKMLEPSAPLTAWSELFSTQNGILQFIQLKACPHLNQIESISISHLDQGVRSAWIEPSIHFDHVHATKQGHSDHERAVSFVHVIKCTPS